MCLLVCVPCRAQSVCHQSNTILNDFFFRSQRVFRGLLALTFVHTQLVAVVIVVVLWTRIAADLPSVCVCGVFIECAVRAILHHKQLLYFMYFERTQEFERFINLDYVLKSTEKKRCVHQPVNVVWWRWLRFGGVVRLKDGGKKRDKP